MKFALASYGTRGDIEPSAAVGRELLRRGRKVLLAVPARTRRASSSRSGLRRSPTVQRVQEFLDEEFLRNVWTDFLRNAWTIRGPFRLAGKVREPIRHWAEASATLMSLGNGADLLSTGLNFEQAAANVAEHYDIPLVTLHHFPMRPNGQLIPRAAVAAGAYRRPDSRRLAVLALDEGRRERAAPRIQPAEGDKSLPAPDRRPRSTGNSGL